METKWNEIRKELFQTFCH